MRAIVRIVSIASIALLLPALPATAALKSFKMPLVQERAANISLEHVGVKITSYQFLRPLRSVEKLLKSDDPVIRLMVESHNAEAQDVAFAVALFDDSGNLVGVSSRSLKLKPGEPEEVDLAFDDLNRYAKHATKLQVSVETHLE